MNLLHELFCWEAVTKLFSSEATVQGMLDFEAALARAEAPAGAIPYPAASAIAEQCRAELFDLQKLARDAGLAGNLAIPVIKQLKELVVPATPRPPISFTSARPARTPSTLARCCRFAKR